MTTTEGCPGKSNDLLGHRVCHLQHLLWFVRTRLAKAIVGP